MVSLLNFETLRPLDADALQFRTKIPVVFLLSLMVPICHGVRGLLQDFLLLCTSNTLFPSTQTLLAASNLAPTESWTPGRDPKAICGSISFQLFSCCRLGKMSVIEMT